jgi:pimeloyl-ACP methyl ester carboxylesterase
VSKTLQPILETVFNSNLKTDIAEFNAALQGEEELQKFCAAVRTEMLKGGVGDMIEAMSSLLPDVDKEAMTKNAEVGQYLVDSIHEGLKAGSDGWVDDDLSMIDPWGFELSEIKVPVILYQGTEDKMVPYAHGEWLAKHLPQEKLRKHLIQGQGHVSIFLGRQDGIIDELLDILKV